MPSYTEEVVAATSDDVRADEMIKQVFSSKQILAKIIKPIIPELNDLSDKEVQNRIEAISTEIPVSAYGNPDKITGSATEDRVVGEGNVNYDIRFSVLCPDKETRECQILVDLEAQGKPNPDYPLSYRAIYYMSRIISSQITDLSDEKVYKTLKKVYTIWICFSPKGITDSISRVRLEQETLVGKYKIPPNHLDLLNYYLVRVSNDGFLKGTGNELLNFLGTLLAPSLEATERVERLKEFIPNDPEFEKEAKTMFGVTEMWKASALKEGFEKGVEQGREKGVEEGQTLLATLLQKLMSAGRSDDMNRAITDPEYRKTLYGEFGLSP